jgi:hypothetical protein
MASSCVGSLQASRVPSAGAGVGDRVLGGGAHRRAGLATARGSGAAMTPR